MKQISCSFKTCDENLVNTLQKMEGVLKVEQVFPGHEDSELARMYVIDIDDDKTMVMLHLLQSHVCVEYANLAARRKVY